MIYSEMPLKEFCEKFDLEPFDWKCSRCGKDFKGNIPVYIKDMSGLVTPEHECGPGFQSVLMTPRTDSAKEFWSKVL